MKVHASGCAQPTSPQLVYGPTLLEKLLTERPPTNLPAPLVGRALWALSKFGTLNSRMLALLLGTGWVKSVSFGQVTDFGKESWDLSALPPLTGVEQIDLTYMSVPFDNNLIDYLMTAEESLRCLTVNHVKPLFF